MHGSFRLGEGYLERRRVACGHLCCASVVWVVGRSLGSQEDGLGRFRGRLGCEKINWGSVVFCLWVGHSGYRRVTPSQVLSELFWLQISRLWLELELACRTARSKLSSSAPGLPTCQSLLAFSVSSYLALPFRSPNVSTVSSFRPKRYRRASTAVRILAVKTL